MNVVLRCLMAFFMFYTCTYAQGPLDGYMKGKGVLDLAPALSFNRSDAFLGKNQREYAVPYKGQLLSVFAEYGLSDNFDVVATGAMVFTALRSGLQDGGLYVKYRPFSKKFKNAGKLGVVLGTGAGFPIADYEPTATGALGQKAIFVPAKLILQWETPIGLFVNLTGGHHWRLDNLKERDIAVIRQKRPDYNPVDPPDFSTFLLKIGLPASRYYLDAWLEYQHVSGGADYVPDVPDLPQAYGVRYLQFGGTAFLAYTPKVGFFLSGAYIFDGYNTAKMTRATLGFVYKIGARN